MSDTVILHISDLHFSSNEKKKREKENIMNSLIDVLKQLETEWKPNVICVSDATLENMHALRIMCHLIMYGKGKQLYNDCTDLSLSGSI